LVCIYTLPEALRIAYAKELGNSFQDQRIVAVTGLVAEVLDPNTIRVPRQDLYEITKIFINGTDALSGQTITSVTAEPTTGVVSAWDKQSGIIELRKKLGELDEVTVDLKYKEHTYLFDGFLEDEVTPAVIHDLDLNPSPGHTYDDNKPTSDLVDKSIYIYLLPSAAYRTIDSSGNVEQNRKIFSGTRFTNYFLRWELVDGSGVEECEGNKKIIIGCNANSTFGHTHFGEAVFSDFVSFNGLLPVDKTSTTGCTGTNRLSKAGAAVVLGSIFISANSQIENVDLIDTRPRGGGIPVDIDVTDNRLPGDTTKEAKTYFDIGNWDGDPVPLGGVVLIELPKEILTGAGGFQKFTQDEIEEIVNKHLAAGVKSIIRYI